MNRGEVSLYLDHLKKTINLLNKKKRRFELYKQLPFFEKKNDFISKLITCLIYLDYGNQALVEKKIFDLVSEPPFFWNLSMLYLSEKQDEVMKPLLNKIIINIIDKLSSEYYRKLFWSYLKKFELKEFKLNEIRDISLVDLEELKQLSLKVNFKNRFFAVWAGEYLEYGDKDDFSRYLIHFKNIELSSISIWPFETILFPIDSFWLEKINLYLKGLDLKDNKNNYMVLKLFRNKSIKNSSDREYAKKPIMILEREFYLNNLKKMELIPLSIDGLNRMGDKSREFKKWIE